MRIAFSGAGGTGKSTLVRAMREIWPEEFGGLTLIDSVRHENHANLNQKERQSFLNKTYRENQLGSDFISARSLYDVYAYSRQTIGPWNEWVQFQGALHKIQYDRVFYLPIEFELESNADGTRPLNKIEVNEFETELQIVLNFYHVPVLMLAGTIENRLRMIAHYMELENGNIRSFYHENERTKTE